MCVCVCASRMDHLLRSLTIFTDSGTSFSALCKSLDFFLFVYLYRSECSRSFVEQPSWFRWWAPIWYECNITSCTTRSLKGCLKWTQWQCWGELSSHTPFDRWTHLTHFYNVSGLVISILAVLLLAHTEVNINIWTKARFGKSFLFQPFLLKEIRHK